MRFFGARYLTTAGRGSHFILNVPPNTTGVVPDEFVASVTGLGDAVRDSFGANVGTTTGSAALSGPCDGLVIVVASTGAAFDAVQLIEDQTNGQSVLAYTLELQSQKGGSWTKVDIDPRLGGQTIGGKNIVVLPPSIAGVTTSSTAGASVRFKCTAAIGGPVAHVSIASMSLHKLVAPPVPPPPPGKAVSLRSFWSAKGNDTAPVAVRVSIHSASAPLLCLCLGQHVGSQLMAKFKKPVSILCRAITVRISPLAKH